MNATVTWSCNGVALGDRRVRVLEVVRELALQLQVLVVPVGAQPLGALGRVLLLERVDVDRRGVLAGVDSSVVVIDGAPASWVRSAGRGSS